ncbi:TetR family transcriptional regulator [Streptomyces sp. LX-29]|uniref:TetR/AcrR family transcriptional regulator n=1 Tax=Streptomyces sp. LX-29 TaxID=2900152 RepID=UPI00240CE667|nr:TetR family transcriptional regulator [Streptomyces sp. LX-29]WFB11619.1 TetR family transcriptional regulator [Streptomyces sp. LX-29]
MPETPKRPRRAPAPDARKLDAERSRRLLLEAAKDEFASKGFAGARVQDIADRAGLNKQLINYYFGGKEGLYVELGRQWLAHEATFNESSAPLDDLVVRYLDEAFADPRGTRLLIWRALTDEAWSDGPEDREDLSDLRRRQAAGELAEEFEPEAVMLMCYALVAAPVAMRHAVGRIYGLDPDSQEFRERYADQLRRVIRRMAGPGPGPAAPPGPAESDPATEPARHAPGRARG